MIVGFVNLGVKYEGICYNIGEWFVNEFVRMYNILFKEEVKYFGKVVKINIV